MVFQMNQFKIYRLFVHMIARRWLMFAAAIVEL
jgi:hypothetical protein